MAQANVARHAAKFDASALAPQSEAGRDTLSDSAPPSIHSSISFHSSLSPSGNLDDEAPLPLELRDNVPMGRLVARGAASGPMTRKKMDEEAIAGTVVGVVLGVALLVCCLYPVLVHRLKKRHKRANRLSIDCETGFRGQPSISARRLSSSDSYKANESSRDNSGRVHDRIPHDAYGYPIWGPQGQIHQASTPVYVNASIDQNLTIDPVVSNDSNYYSNSFPFCHGENLPGGALAPHQIVLKGTSEDYYSPHIPSEAFGMYPTPETDTVIPKPKRTVSRASSFGYNVKQLFRRQNTRDSSHASVSRSCDPESDVPPHLRKATPMQQFFPHQEMAPSPIEMTDAAELPFSTRAFGSQDDIPPESSRAGPEAISPASPYSERLFSHPNQPAPGTVNPMDIMPASTESEVWHRNDYQLHTTSYESPPPIAPVPMPSQPLNSVNQSELSTPAQGTQGTASITTQSTPSTHVDSPSPESLHSSDYRQSASPHGMGIPSPRGGVYYCDEPGCSQVFDQPHKLKHHQRYHSKDHKCPYPSCGKGFGTKTHLQRHINDRHEKKKKFHCSIPGCDYSRAGGKAFPRKDNWKRHMTKIHGMDHSRLPEPVEIDQEMTGA